MQVNGVLKMKYAESNTDLPIVLKNKVKTNDILAILILSGICILGLLYACIIIYKCVILDRSISAKLVFWLMISISVVIIFLFELFKIIGNILFETVIFDKDGIVVFQKGKRKKLLIELNKQWYKICINEKEYKIYLKNNGERLIIRFPNLNESEFYKKYINEVIKIENVPLGSIELQDYPIVLENSRIRP